jgi:hypothetical protein
MRRLLFLLGVLVTFLALVPSVSHANTTAIRQTQYTCLTDSCARTMTSDVTFQRSGAYAGQLYALTTTKNAVMFSGFTGGVFVVMRNADHAVVGVSDLHTFGVDGTWIGTSVRTDGWMEHIDPQIAAATSYIEIVQTLAPKERISEILNRIQQYKAQGCQIVKVLACN